MILACPSIQRYRDDGITQGSQILRGITLIDLACVFAKRDITNVMRAIFDAPMASLPSEQLSCIGLVTIIPKLLAYVALAKHRTARNQPAFEYQGLENFYRSFVLVRLGIDTRLT